jgi:uroporphyrinogen decarboxylase
MDSRERVLRVLNHEEADRVPFIDFPWGETLERWYNEGLPRGVSLNDYFGYDIYLIGPDTSPKYDNIVIEEDDTFRTFIDSWGVMVKAWIGKSGTPHPVGPPLVSTIEDFKEKLEPLLDPELPIRVSSSRYPFRGELERGISRLKERYAVFCSIVGPFETARHILGESVDKILITIHRDPGLVKYVFRCLGQYFSRIVETYLELGVDGLWVWDDLAYNKGPFFSPRVYEELVKPAHAQITSAYRAKNAPTILHTDGNVNLLIPKLIEAGFTVIQPLEAKAGMDVVELKEKYGKVLSFIGNLDARKIANPREIEDEISRKIPVAKEGGGYVACSDHSIPPDVSFSAFQEYIKLIRKYGVYT